MSVKKGGLRENSGRKKRMEPKEPWEYQEKELKTGLVKESTGRMCELCHGEIERKFYTETDKATGTVVTKICKWDERYTCSVECRKKWLKLQDNRTGSSERDENGVQISRSATDPLSERMRDRGIRWGHNMNIANHTQGPYIPACGSQSKDFSEGVFRIEEVIGEFDINDYIPKDIIGGSNE